MARVTFWEWWEKNQTRFWENFSMTKPILPQIKDIAQEAWMTAVEIEEDAKA